MLIRNVRALEVKDYWPISLVNGLYKIISNLLASCLGQVLGWIIMKTQIAFVRGRQILDSVFIANETGW